MTRSWLLAVALGLAACSEPPEAPPPELQDAPADDQKVDPLKVGRELIDEREQEGHLDHAIRLLEWHALQHPESAAIHLLAAEACSRALEDLQGTPSDHKERIRELLLKGRKHGDEAVRLEPANGAALYWKACLLLHQADVDKSLGKAKEALGILDKAETLQPAVDDGGPARMKGRVYFELPGLFGGSLSKALANYRKSIDLSPDCITTHLWLGEAYVEGGKADLARKELDWVLAAKPRPGHEKEDGTDRKKAEDLLKSLKQ